MPTDKPRVSITLTEDELEAINRYKTKNGIKSQSQAIIKLLEIGYAKMVGEMPQAELDKLFLKKYHQLDLHGKDMVDTVLQKEHKRCTTKETPEKTVQIIELPYSLYKVSAGGGYMLSEEVNTSTLPIILTPTVRKADFCINVSGESMLPDYSDGDIILVRKQPAVDIGEVGIFSMEGEAYIKKNGKRELISLNPEYPNIKKSNDIKCWGKVLGKVQKEWIKE